MTSEAKKQDEPMPPRKYPAVTPLEPFRPHGGEAGHNGSALYADEVRDPDGDGKRQLTTLRRIDRLLWLHQHHHIAQHQFDAGQKLQEDWQLSKIEIAARNDMSGGRSGGNARSTLSDAKCDAISRLGRALAVLPPEIESIITLFLLTEGEAFSLERCAARVKRHPRAALPLLEAGLSLLSRHYGYG